MTAIFSNYLLIIFLFSPFIWCIYIFFLSENTNQTQQKLISLKFKSLLFSLITFLIGLMIFFKQQNSLISYNIFIYTNWFNFLNINYVIGLDGISLIFLLLTSFLFPICILVSWNNPNYKKKYFFLILFLAEFFLLNFFVILDLFTFFVFFESILIPMYLLIGIWGSNLRKVYASYQLFFFTALGSIFMLAALIALYKTFGTFDFYSIELISLFQNSIKIIDKILIFSFIFITFSVKIPIVPFHFWLPEAHVEAPTSGSIILAGILLKLGAYGLIRFLYPIFTDIIIYLNPLLWTICLYSIFYISFIILRQLDLKRIIAYSSVIHMNFILLGLLIFAKSALIGSTFLLISHGIVSPALFICIGILYERYHTRILLYYKSLVTIMPLYVFFFFVLF